MSSTSSRSSNPPSGRKRKYTEQELRHTLDLLNSIPRPLSPTLPPSPPASPAPPHQRRRMSPGTDRASTPSTQNSSPPAPTARRPALTPAELARIIPLYKERAKLFKRSGDSRKRNDQRSGRLGLMELTDSVLHFAYVFWAEDREKTRPGNQMWCEAQTWRTLEGLVRACKSGWTKDTDPAAKGLHGMLTLLEALVLNKITYWNITQLREGTKGLIIAAPPTAAASATNPNTTNAGTTPNPNAAGTPNHPTPPSHVPSPAPTTTSTSRSPVPPAQTQQALHHPLPQFYLQNVVKHSSQFMSSQMSIASAYALLNPAFMRTHYPRTHGICTSTSLGSIEEGTPGGADIALTRLVEDGLEVDLDACVKGEGMWAWPIVSGVGMAHFIGFGRSMLWEFGRERGGYRGADGMNVDY